MTRQPEPENWQRWSPQQHIVHHHHSPLQQPWPPAQAPAPALPTTYIMEQHSQQQQVPPQPPQSYGITPLIQQYPVHHGYVYEGYPPPNHHHHAPEVAKQYLPEDRPMINMATIPPHGLHEPLHQGQGQVQHQVQSPVEYQHQHQVQSPVQEAHHMPIVVKQQQASLSPVIKAECHTPEDRKESQAMTVPVQDGQAATVAASSSSSTTTDSTSTATTSTAANTAYSTGIDRLMKIIQQKTDPTAGDAKPAQSTKSKGRSGNGSGAIRKRTRTDVNHAELLDKPHACQRKRCTKRFSQITHLHIHERAHTGERPHQCTFAGCDKRFTQKGNLRTHERRHLGERPFKCHITGCTRAFPQKGNLAAHLETHYKRNSFRCILRACNKTFSSRGNLKTHQNNYHKDELYQLELKFSNIYSMTEMTQNDRELWDYFLTVHKNSNKGIKGRGKECRVELVTHAANPLPPNSHHHHQQYALQSPVELHQHAPFPISHSLPNSMGFGHFGMQRPNLGQDFLVARGGHGYDVYDMDQASISSGTITPASSPGGMYEEQQQHHHRSLPFHNRMY
ncbi:hypothetical protein FHL15_003775 [Xylaria flabelliformis]|uniref:C2H2-type domain-containing protein n=1 Tax=Xylaria flabelliformis TaxID=2512241 RepID=A0A553I5K5_9PEZI|nr:hypothetical protein FHL15_003775 [Xylaria flabelliformis]